MLWSVVGSYDNEGKYIKIRSSLTGLKVVKEVEISGITICIIKLNLKYCFYRYKFLIEILNKPEYKQFWGD